MNSNQSGFTLIEIAIVVGIIGLLLGGMLKGQELINSAKVKNLATDFKNIPVNIYGYQDKYKASPGDDRAATTHLTLPPGTPPTVVINNGNGSSIIDGAWNAPSGESFEFWQQIRLASLGSGAINQADPAYVPTNAVGGTIGVTNSQADTPITGMTGTYVVCSSSIPGKMARQLDITLDDGNTATGLMMISGGANPPPPAPTPTANIVDDQAYLVCMGF